MSIDNIHGFSKVLQDPIQLEDEIWSYQVPTIPHPSILNAHNLLKSISVVSNDAKQQIILTLQHSSPNRAVASFPPDRFVTISFADFRLRVPLTNSGQKNGTQPATARESSDYVVRLLRAGIILNHVHYNFYGHSNSQLKSRSCFLIADSKLNVQQMIENLGDFTKMKTVAKKSKRIGLLFSSAPVAMNLDPARCQDIPDIEKDGYIFTDGCGIISAHFAHELARKSKITFRNRRYTPSVFQIRYRGYKGVLTLDTAMKGEFMVKFRKSMKKFSGGSDYSFSVIEHSKVILKFFLWF